LVLEAVVVNNATVLRLLGVGDSGSRGILRVHLNLLPYLFFMVGVLGCVRLAGQIARSRKRWPMLVASGTVMASVAADVLVLKAFPRWYGKPLTADGAAIVPSPTLVRLPRSLPPSTALILCHVLAALVLLVSAAPGTMRRARQWTVAVAAVLAAFGTVTGNLELLSRSSAQWHWVTDSTYRLDAFRERRDCIEALAPIDDPGARVMYTSGASLSSTFGRSWGNLMELELGQASGQHPLFSYRELDLPIVGVYYGFFGIQQNTLLFPPLADAVGQHPAVLRLLGVRYVVSDHAPLSGTSTQDFRLLGTCSTATGPTRIRGVAMDPFLTTPLSAAGTSYVYEVSNSPGIFSVACAEHVLGQDQQLSTIARSGVAPWEHGIVWTEVPLSTARDMSCDPGDAAGTVEDVTEHGSQVAVRVDAKRDVALVASYALRDGWSATVDGHDVPIRRAYGGLMSVAVPAGTHEVEFSYHSNALSVGFAILALSGLTLVVGGRWQRRSKDSTPSIPSEPATELEETGDV
jgi:hypothetical protein